MNKGIIITLPHHDYVTEYLSHFSGHIVNKANEKRIKIKALKVKAQTEMTLKQLLKNLIIR